jgi:hypothetical protein
MSLPPERKLEWEAEARYLRNRIQTDRERLAELEEILMLLFPKGAA